MSRIWMTGVIVCCLASFAAAQGEPLPSHWDPGLWNGFGVVTPTEEHIVLTLDQNNEVSLEPFVDPFGIQTQAWMVRHIPTGVLVAFYREFGGPMNLVGLGVAEFGGATLSPFADPGPGTRLVMEVLDTGIYAGQNKGISRVSWEMGDAVDTDEDTYRATASEFGPFGGYSVNLGPRLLDYDNSLPSASEPLGTDVKWIQHARPIGYFTAIAGSEEPAGNPPIVQANSVYYDNFVLTFDTINPDGTVGATSDAPQTDFGGGDNSDAANGDGMVTEGPPAAAEPEPVDQFVSTSYGRMTYNRRTGELSATVTITNTSATTLGSPMWLVVQNISDPNISVVNADGTTSGGDPYIDMSGLLGADNELSPGESVNVPLTFSGRGRFTFDLSVWDDLATPPPPASPASAPAPSTTPQVVGSSSTSGGSGPQVVGSSGGGGPRTVGSSNTSTGTSASAGSSSSSASGSSSGTGSSTGTRGTPSLRSRRTGARAGDTAGGTKFAGAGNNGPKGIATGNLTTGS